MTRLSMLFSSFSSDVFCGGGNTCCFDGGGGSTAEFLFREPGAK